MSQSELEKIIDELIKLGEDKEELTTLAELFPMLDEEAKLALVASLKKELDELNKK